MIFFIKNHQKIKIILNKKQGKKGEKIHISTKLSTFDKPCFMGIWAVFHTKNYKNYLVLSTAKIIISRFKNRKKIREKSLFIIMQNILSNKNGNRAKPLWYKGFMVFEYFEEKCINPSKPRCYGVCLMHKKLFKIFFKKLLTNITLSCIMQSQSQRKSKSKILFDFYTKWKKGRKLPNEPILIIIRHKF